ncbi:MAG: hypothetical protein AAGJ46_07440 [Planctomycetota bacterium]
MATSSSAAPADPSVTGERDLRKALTVATCIAVLLGVASIRLLVGGGSRAGESGPLPTPPAVSSEPSPPLAPEVLLPQVLLPAPQATSPTGRTAYRPVSPEAPPQPLR